MANGRFENCIFQSAAFSENMKLSDHIRRILIL